MAIITVASNKFNTTINTHTQTLASGDTLNLLAGAGLYNSGNGVSQGISAAGANSLVLNGDVFSKTSDAINIAAGGNDINVGANSTVYGDAGIAIAGSAGNSIGIAGHVVATGGPGIDTDSANNTINLLAGSTVAASGVGLNLNNSPGSNIVTVAGHVTSASNAGIEIGGGSSVVTIASTGRLVGLQGLFDNNSSGLGSTGANQVINHGVLAGASQGLLMFSILSFVQNFNLITGDTTGVDISASTTPGTKHTIINSGTIVGGTNAAYDGDDNIDDIVNTGTMLCFGTAAIITKAGNDIVTNNGIVQGSALAAIRLGNGDDTYNGAGGTVNGTVFGENNNDTLIGGAGVDVFDGGSGANTMSGGGGGDYLTATGNLNVANGDDGADQLFFVGNQNQLFGGNDNDWLGVGGDNNALSGSAGDDLLGATGNANTLAGNFGNDISRGWRCGQLPVRPAWQRLRRRLRQQQFPRRRAGRRFHRGDRQRQHARRRRRQRPAGRRHPHRRPLRVPSRAMPRTASPASLRHGGGGTDVLDVNGFGLNFTTIQTFMADVGGNCVFTLNGADILTVNGVLKAEFLATDFIF